MSVAAHDRPDVVGTWASVGNRRLLLLLAIMTMMTAVASRPLLATLTTGAPSSGSRSGDDPDHRADGQTKSPFETLLRVRAQTSGADACDNLAIDTGQAPTYRMPLGGSPLVLGASQQGIRCESGAAPQR